MIYYFVLCILVFVCILVDRLFNSCDRGWVLLFVFFLYFLVFSWFESMSMKNVRTFLVMDLIINYIKDGRLNKLFWRRIKSFLGFFCEIFE